MQLIIASTNKGKIKEYKDIFEPLGFLVRSQHDEGIELEVEETGTTFEENALLKAQAVYNLVHCCVISDDSGLVAGFPGIGRGNGTLERVNEAGAENVITGLGHSGIGRECRDIGNTDVLGDRAGCQCALGRVRTYNGKDFFFFNQFLINVDSFFLRTFGIGIDEFDRIFNTVDLDLSAESVLEDLCTVAGIFTGHGSSTGHRESEADLDGFFSLDSECHAEDHHNS